MVLEFTAISFVPHPLDFKLKLEVKQFPFGNNSQNLINRLLNGIIG